MRSDYENAFKQAGDRQTRIKYWENYCKMVSWSKQPEQILTNESEYIYTWFKDGQLNMSYNCIDRHLLNIPDNNAIIYESPMTKQTRQISFKELHQNVSKLGAVLHSLGLQKGDTCIIYMPMIPEAIFAMLACARIGITHSVVFGGFAAKELASRIQDCKPKLIFSASCGIEPHKFVNYKEILDDAIQQSGHTLKTIILQREQKIVDLKEGQDYDYFKLLNEMNEESQVVQVQSDHPLYILYTSGTTGKPKGITRDTGGTAVALSWTMHHIKNIHQGDVYFSSSDIGWVVGHSFIVYGPLLMGATTILYEGKPNTPDPGIFWSLIEKYNVKGFYTAPTAVRFLRKEDPNGDFIKKYNISSLKCISLAGERCDIPTFQWLQKFFPNTLINDNYWQTETGWMISCNYSNLTTFEVKAGSATKPVPGQLISILDENNISLPQGQIGRICSKLPLPPSFMLGLWNNQEAFIEKYLKESPGYYTSGDAGYFDEDGYLHVMTRLDDVINTAGHRLSTAQMEEVLLQHPDIVEAAVVAHLDSLKGEIPVGFVVLKKGVPQQEKLQQQLAQLIRRDIGPVACYKDSIVVDKLPKTKSGKILRGTMKKIISGKKYVLPATIEDESVLQLIENSVKLAGFGKQDILYEEDM